jgi:tRNA modification GTPase
VLARHQDPIAAIATAPGRGAIGIVRVSGKDLKPLAQAVCGRQLRAREATYCAFVDHSGQAIDHGLAIYFSAPHSFTGEDVLELQAHGGPVVLQLLLARVIEAATENQGDDGRTRLAGLRVALPGEFSERAFLNGKIDLTQAEAIADLIAASTEAAARSAGRSLSGALSKEVHLMRDALIQLRLLVEATLDFPEEETDFLRKSDAFGQLSNLQQGVQTVLQKAHQGALLAEGIKVVIAGQPNAGKSSLLNALAGAELAIVTPVAGTTRDKVQQTIQIEGVPVHVVDTAGLRDSEDEVEKIGIAHAWDAIEAADVVLFLHDLTRLDVGDYRVHDAAIASLLAQKLSTRIPVVDLWNKVDAVVNPSHAEGLSLSSKTGLGLDALRRQLLDLAGWQALPDGVCISRQRHVQTLRRVHDHLREANIHLTADAGALDLLAEELRLAQNALSEITGEFTSDDLLGAIFSRFCIGK